MSSHYEIPILKQFEANIRKLSKSRESKYRELFSKIGNTSLVEYKGAVDNSNRILIKRECDNPFGSHYDRVYLHLFAHHEACLEIKPGDKVIETTSGSAGVSFAGLGKQLGFECLVAIPEGGEKARENAILANDAELIMTPENHYISGLPRFIKRFLVKNRDVFFLNHSSGKKNTNNELAVSALSGIAREIKQDYNIDYFCPAIGNGSSVLGPGREFGGICQTIGFETVSSAVAYDLLGPGSLEDDFKVSASDFERHKLPGTSFIGVNFPHIKSSISEGVLSKVVLVSDRVTDKKYYELTGLNLTQDLPHWDDPDCVFEDTGRTTAASLSVAKYLASKSNNKTFLIIAYDKSERYD